MSGSDDTNRREFLTAAGTAATIGVAGLAGCTDVLGSDESSSGAVDDHVEWIPLPADLHDELDHLSVSSGFPSNVASEFSSPSTTQSFDQIGDYGRIPESDVDYVVSASGSAYETEEIEPEFGEPYEQRTDYGNYEIDVVAATFDADWAQQNLENAEFNREGGYKEFTLYQGDEEDGDETTAYAVGEDAIVRAMHEDLDYDEFDEESQPEHDPLSVVEAVVDAKVADATRYIDDSEDLQLVVESLQSGDWFDFRTHEETEEEQDFEGNDLGPEDGHLVGKVAEGSWADVRGTDADVGRVVVFLDERDVRDRDIEEYIEESGTFSTYRNKPEYEIDGRTVVISGTDASTNHFL